MYILIWGLRLIFMQIFIDISLHKHVYIDRQIDRKVVGLHLRESRGRNELDESRRNAARPVGPREIGHGFDHPWLHLRSNISSLGPYVVA